MKPFNLEEAKAGKPVCTRDGKPVRILCFDRKSDIDECIVCAILKSKDIEIVEAYYSNGRWLTDSCSDNDLMMATVKKEGYIALIKPDYKNDNIIMNTTNVYPSAEACNEKVSNVKGYIKTIKIEWEE